MTTYINFDKDFEPQFMQYGSTQQVRNEVVKTGKGRMKYLKAKGAMLSYGEDNEEIHVMAINPTTPGIYTIKVSAYSENGLSLTRIFHVDVIKHIDDSLMCDAKQDK